MGKANEEKVLAFLKSFHDPNSPDLEHTVSFFAEDGYYQALVPATGRLHGRLAIRQALEKQFTSYRDLICEIHSIGSNDTQVFTERSDHVTLLLHDGRRVASRVCAVFDLNEAGLIVGWREYWDTGNVLQQMGVDRAVMEQFIN